MPQSVLDQIMAAIAKADDEAQRALLLSMLQLAESINQIKSCVMDTAEKVVGLKGDLDAHVLEFKAHDVWEKTWRNDHFRGIPADDHVAQHGVVKELVIERRKTAEVVQEAKKGFAGQIGKMAALALVSLLAGAVGTLGAIKLFGGL